ncbi:hypothetical protein PF010_g28249 [Phytophthora fragariae]|uniref:Reverse transcriptase Ty1/copia-type domain-containing protein n=4 Tax=Phytophthora fragariae TaxID=53985 RepID=A0A6A3DUZ6_9STRA|nr:hypothetical protein PF003_g31006 [Phytophthora fragariae]KAE8921548.1 hypothetical protein PF009_g28177 [Phytophthora fragariae]KAE9065323.1 hypothetical protein PF010_g28249 [Phytophthora fragariae]
MRTRYMGKKHVSVGSVSAVMLKDPKNVREAMRDPRGEKWKQAIREEIEALEQNGTWKVVKKPENAKLLHTKWVFKLKTHADGTIERYKARLVARGDEQEYGVDYTYTFSAVLDMESGKIILVVSRIWKVPARHGDVPSAYVKAKKEAELVIMLFIPTGMEFTEKQLRALGVKSKYELALLLEKGLYGLKQSGRLWNHGRLWNQLLHSILLSLGFRLCYSDSCLYVKIEEDGMTLVGVYVDDILVTATSVEKVDKFFQDMQVVELKDLGVVSKFLGVAFSYDEEDGWDLDQEQVIQDMLVKFGLDKAAPVSTPIGGEQDGEAPGELLPSGGAGTPGRPTVRTFQSLVGSLLWISRCTRPDISFAVHRATRNSHAPSKADWRLAKRIAKYLKGTKSIKFSMNADENAMGEDGVLVEAYSDADYAADKKDRKSVSGGVVMMAGAVVAWMCKKQACVALSTMESEFVAASHTTARMLGVIECLKEIGIKVRVPSLLHVDNQAAIAQLKGEDTTGHAKHIDTRHKFVKDFVKKKVLLINYCESKKMRADVLMKVLPAPRLAELRGLVMLSG